VVVRCAKTQLVASAQRNVDFIVEQMAEARDVSARKMFGEYAIYCRGKLIALFCDDQLFVKPTNAGRAFLGKPQEAPPYPGAKPYFLIRGDQCEDGEWLSELARLTERELPPPKPKPAAKRPDRNTKPAQKLAKKIVASPSPKRASAPRAPRRKPAAKQPAPPSKKPR
jgi:TfoX/Sxy family transcriptional regulator of competence genes